MSSEVSQIGLGLVTPNAEIAQNKDLSGGSFPSPESSLSKHSEDSARREGESDEDGVKRLDKHVEKENGSSSPNNVADTGDGAPGSNRWQNWSKGHRSRSLKLFPTLSSIGGEKHGETGTGGLRSRNQLWSRRNTDAGTGEMSGDGQDTDSGVIERIHPDDLAAKIKVKHRYLPILSGLACPFAVLLDIPGLTEKWYVRTYGYEIIDSQPNPIILDIGLAVSMGLGLLANFALISRFLERKPYYATLLAIVALTIHDIINIVVVVVFGVVHRIDDGFTYGDAYWMTVASTVASLTCNVTLIVDLYRTPNFRLHGSGLTEKQRSLVIACMALLCYIGLGSLVFSLLLSPKLAYIDSLYFTICTITSVGFGDISPNTLSSRLFSFLYDTAGLALLALTIAVARETVIETFEASYRKRREVLAVKARERKEEKRKRDKLRRERRERELREAVERGLNSKVEKQPDDPDWEKPKVVSGGGRGGAASSAVSRAQRQLDFRDDKEKGVSAGKAYLNYFLRKMGLMKAYTPAKKEDPASDDLGFGLERTLTSASITSEEGYKSFKKQIQQEQTSEFRLKLGIAMILFFSFWLVGAAVFHFTEQWAYFDAMYFCFVFFSTIGYGDLSPKSSAGRAFFIAWSMFGIAAMTLLLSVVTETWSSRYKSSIAEGKVKRRFRKMGANMAESRRKSEDHNKEHALELLALEGFRGNEASIEPKDLPHKLTEAVKGFHEHARFFMHGRTGDPPESLRSLIDAADEFDDEFEKLQEDGDLEGGATNETRHFLFMVSYERALDGLIDATEQLNDVFNRHSAELDEMKSLNVQLRETLQQQLEENEAEDDGDLDESGDVDEDGGNGDDDGGDDGGDDDGQNSDTRLGIRDLLPFKSTRRAGSISDDKIEEKLCEELDEPGRDEDEDDSAQPKSMRINVNGPTPTNSNPPSPHPSVAPSIASQNPSVSGHGRVRASSLIAGATLRRSSTYLNQLSSSTPERIDLTRGGRHSGNVTPTSNVSPSYLAASSEIQEDVSASPGSTSDSMPKRPPRNPALAISKVPSLSFAEPPSPRPRSASSSSKGVIGLADRFRHHHRPKTNKEQ